MEPSRSGGLARISVDVGRWMLAWFIAWGFYYALISHDVNYISHPIGTAAYFLSAAAVVLVVYKDLFLTYIALLKPVSWTVPGLAFVVGLVAYVVLPLVLTPPHTLMVKNKDMFFLHLDLRYLFSKLFDILFQQVLIFLLIALLLRRKLSLRNISFLCCGLLGIVHLYLLKQNGLALGGYFVLFSMASGLTFPFLIVRCRTGLAYTSSLHLLFYVITGVVCWLCPSALV